MRSTEETVKNMSSIRDQVLDYVDEHEQEAHGGAPCKLERCNVVAYLGHCLGLPLGSIDTVATILHEYNTNCTSRECSHGGGPHASEPTGTQPRGPIGSTAAG
jgi:hypothetical protein